MNRNAKQCRERWLNHLDPEKRSKRWSINDILKLFEVQKLYGNSWSKIARVLAGKPENAIKNFYYATLRRNLRRFNKTRASDEKLNQHLDDLMKIPELRKILTVRKNVHIDKVWAGKKMSDETLGLLGLILVDIGLSGNQGGREVQERSEKGEEDGEDFDVGFFLQDQEDKI
jgi:hypothetical protein